LDNDVAMRKDGFAPIGAYAAIGDGRTTALVALDGSIDFLSLPAIHAPTTFGALLDPERSGRYVLQPKGRFDAERRYVDRTNVLETTYTTGDGVVRVTEALTLRDGGLLPWVEVVRGIEGLAGEVPMRWSVEPRFDWGRMTPTFARRRGIPVVEGRDLALALHNWDAGEPAIAEDSVSGTFTTAPGSSSLLALCCTDAQPIPIPARDDVERRLRGTVDSWRRWLDAWSYDGPWPDEVARSALALKLLVYAPLGAIVAAPTTSLPERIGGDRNFDYRYMWVRDTSFTLEALLRLGLPEQVHESFSCLLRAVKATAPDLHPFYTVDGDEARRCDLLPLRGYRDSLPVRYGNAASTQLQLGSWGDLLETTDLYVESGSALDGGTAEMLAGCIDRLCLAWRDEDSGIWELDDLRHYTSSKLGVWTAFDRAAKLVDLGELPPAHAGRWRQEREAAVAFVQERCWNEALQSYVEYAGGDELDAAVLRGARMGWDKVDARRFDASVAAVRERLDAGDGLLYRTTRTQGEEGAFVACSFWLVDALARRGRVDEAAELFEQMLAHANDVGLFAEEVDPASGELLGNFPQGLSHLALVNAAGSIEDARGVGASATADAGSG
jgi:GH15 family glucan-1,4-alpha-glucosidase